VSVVDEGDGDRTPWTQYLTIKGETYPEHFGPFKWRFASWHNISRWVPENPEVIVADIYTAAWKDPFPGSAAHYFYNRTHTPIPKEMKAPYFQNKLDINAASILELQERLEKENAKQIQADAEKQWVVAMDHCSMKPEEHQGTLLGTAPGPVSLSDFSGLVKESAEEVYKRTVF